MRTRYQELFDEVRASERLKKEVMEMTKQERTRVAKKISVSFVLAAALAVILAGTALAAVIGVPETLQEWFEKQWMETAGGEEMPKEQAAVIESLVQPVGVSAKSSGVTITLDSVAPGEDGLWMLLKITGLREETRWDFMDFSLVGEPVEEPEMSSVSISTYSTRYVGMIEEETQVQLIYYQSSSGRALLKGGEMELKLEDMYCTKWNEAGDWKNIEREGEWTLPFNLEPVGDQPFLTAQSAQVAVSKLLWGEEDEDPIEQKSTLKLQNIRVTSTGYRFERPLGQDEWTIEAPNLVLEDGTEIRGNGSFHIHGDSEMRGSWDIPVDLAKVESIRFGDVVIPLEEPKK